MGTNYYLRKRVTVQEYYNYDLYRYDHYHVFDTLENGFVFNNRYYPTEEEVNKVLYVELHIGKASAGWHFGLCIYPELNINNLEDWKREFNVSGNKIYDEYYVNSDDCVSIDDMLDTITNRSSDVNEVEYLKSINAFHKELGYKQYGSYDELLRDNSAKRGHRGLWAHNYGNYVLTGGPYDLTPDWDFS